MWECLSLLGCICSTPQPRTECDTRTILNGEYLFFQFSVYLLPGRLIVLWLKILLTPQFVWVSWRRNRWILFPSKMQKASARIWTRFVRFIFNDNNHHTKRVSPSLSLSLSLSLSQYIYMCVCLCTKYV